MVVLAVVVTIVAAFILVLTAAETSVAAFIRLFRTTYCWAGEVLSDKPEDKFTKHVVYLIRVEQQVTPDMNSMCSKTPITGALMLLKGELEEELKESWYIVHKWMKKTSESKRRPSNDFIKNLERSKSTIDLKLGLFLAAVNVCREEEAQHKYQIEKRCNTAYQQSGESPWRHEGKNGEKE